MILVSVTPFLNLMTFRTLPRRVNGLSILHFRERPLPSGLGGTEEM